MLKSQGLACEKNLPRVQDEKVERGVGSFPDFENKKTLDALQERIEAVWDEVVGDGAVLRKAIIQFRPRLKAIVAQHGHSIKKCFS